MAVAERFGVLPHVVENECDEYWLNQIATIMEAEAIDRKRRDEARK